MMSVRAFLVFASLAVLSGCESIAMVNSDVAENAGIQQSLLGGSSKTFSTTLPTLRLATLGTLKRMGIAISANTATEKGWKILGKSSGRAVKVSLERVTRRTTRMNVMVERGIPLLGDAATGTEIILQATEALDRLAVRG